MEQVSAQARQERERAEDEAVMGRRGGEERRGEEEGVGVEVEVRFFSSPVGVAVEVSLGARTDFTALA